MIWTVTYDEYAGYDCMTSGWRVSDDKGDTVLVVDERHFDTPEEAAVIARLVVSAPRLFADAISTNQGYDWFIDQLTSLLDFEDMSASEIANTLDSLIAHLRSRQIGTRAVIAAASPENGKEREN